jgi:hypothetical protein
MKTLVLYRPDSEFSTATEQYAREFERRTGQKIELTDIDSPEGSRLQELYDITNQPAILVLSEEGQLQNSWLGTNFPLIDEVAGHLK